MELVSIVIPVYNVETYLERCVASVVGQSYPHLEIILVDDGSTDRCPAICDEWAQKDSRIRVIHQTNGGVSAARNTGLAVASGSYVLQLDSDDYIASYAIEDMMNTARETGADLTICDFAKGSDLNYSFSENRSKNAEVVDARTALLRIYIDSTNALKYAAPCFKLYKKELFAGIQYPVGKIFEDIYITHKLLYRCNRIAVLDEPLVYYFQRPGSIVNASFSMKKLDYLQALVERMEFFAAHELKDLEQITYDELLHSLIWEYSRTRDVLHSREGMDYVTTMFRQLYKKGYSSCRYPGETAPFLAAFNRNPEWIILYWKLRGKWNRIFKRNG